MVALGYLTFFISRGHEKEKTEDSLTSQTQLILLYFSIAYINNTVTNIWKRNNSLGMN